MSLINKMLAELKKQKKPVDDNQQATIAAIYTPPPSEPKNKTLINLLSILFILAFIIGVIIYIYHAIRPTKSIQFSKPIVQVTQPIQPITQPVVKPTLTNLESYNITTADNKTLLHFMLSAKTNFSIDRSIDQRELTINLSNTTINNPLPHIDLDKNLIEDLTTTQSSADTKIHLKFPPNIQAENVEFLSPMPELQITLSNIGPLTLKVSKVEVPTSPDVEAQKRYDDTVALISQNQMQSAIERLYLLLGDFPNHVAARELLAELLIKNEKLQQAKEILDAGLKRYPGYIPFVKLKAYIYAKKGNAYLAIELLENNKPADISEDPDYYTLLANMYQEQGKNTLAAEIYYKLTKVQPENAAFWVGLATALEASNKHNAAIEAYQKALDTGNLPIELRDFVLTKLKNN